MACFWCFLFKFFLELNANWTTSWENYQKRFSKCVYIHTYTYYIHTHIRLIITYLYILSGFFQCIFCDICFYIFLKKNLQAILDLRKFNSVLQYIVNIMCSEWQNCSIYPTHYYTEIFQLDILSTWRFFFQVSLHIYYLCTFICLQM